VTMKTSGIPTRKLAIGYALGALAAFAVVFVIALIAGLDAGPAFLAALFVGLIAGGVVGFMLAARKSGQT
jgi:hypothetical protein